MQKGIIGDDERDGRLGRSSSETHKETSAQVGIERGPGHGGPDTSCA